MSPTGDPAHSFEFAPEKRPLVDARCSERTRRRREEGCVTGDEVVHELLSDVADFQGDLLQLLQMWDAPKRRRSWGRRASPSSSRLLDAARQDSSVCFHEAEEEEWRQTQTWSFC